MCARYTMVTPVDELIEEFEATLRVEDLPPQFNIAPTDEAPIVVETEGSERRLGLARFGLIPSWATSARQGVEMLNARVETVATRPAYRAAFRRRRCLVVADGFYEWKRDGRRKQPYRFHLGGRPFGLAGLWSTWRDADQQKLSSFTILTRSAVGVTATIHDRMPIIVPRASYGPWLSRLADTSIGDLHALLEGHLGEALERTRVSTRVNSVKNDDPALIEPVA